MDEWFGASWTRLGFVVLSTAAVYLSVLIAVRLTGRRTLAQLSAFDIVVTIALGSMVATVALTPDVSYLQGMASILTLLLLQVGVAALRRAWPGSRRFLDFTPVALLRDGELQLRATPWSAQVNEEELRARLRQEGVWDLDEATLVLLEPTGQISVRRRRSGG